MPLDLSQYVMIEVGLIVPVLSREQEQELFQQLEKNPNNTSAKEKIIESNLGLVAFWIRKISTRRPIWGLALEDLSQEGIVGLMRAIKSFDWKKGYKFSTYAGWWIYQAIIRAIENNGPLIRLPNYMYIEVGKFLRAQRELTAVLGQEPSIEEIAEKLTVSPQHVR